jgi:hypothetical protein
VVACQWRPGFPTFDEARLLVEFGFKNRLMEDVWFTSMEEPSIYLLIPATVGNERGFAGSIATATGRCTFLDNRLCELHDTGAKPFECRMTLCDDRSDPNAHTFPVETWDNPAAQDFVQQWRRDEL